MRRPNLAAKQFLDVRPVMVAGGVLALIALALSALSLGEVVQARGREKSYAEALARLEARRSELTAKVADANRKLAAVGWKKLGTETAAMEGVVARRKLVWSQLLVDLERSIPWDVRLTSIAPAFGKDGGLLVGLTGIATGRDAWLKLLAHLFTDPKFSDPMPLSEEAPSATNSAGYRFQLTVHYWPEGRR
jgi:Tfp pilus assembly protein PilN